MRYGIRDMRHGIRDKGYGGYEIWDNELQIKFCTVRSGFTWFGLVWPGLAPLDPVWPYLTPFDPIWPHLALF